MGWPSVPWTVFRFLSFLVAKLFSAIKANLALFSLPLRTGTDRPQCGAGQEGRPAQHRGPPWTRSRELQTLFEQCGGGVGWVIVGSGVNVEEA